MSKTTLMTHLCAQFPDQKVSIEGDGYHYQATIISTQFSGLSKVQRQQLVYRAINPLIASGEIHAVTLTTLTPDEAEAVDG